MFTNMTVIVVKLMRKQSIHHNDNWVIFLQKKLSKELKIWSKKCSLMNLITIVASKCVFL